MKLIDIFTDFIYPPRCIVCEEVIDVGSGGYCKDCAGLVKRIPGTACFNCGLEQKWCKCKHYFYHFDGIVAPYYNEGLARKAVYDLKFARKFRCLNEFSKDMADCARKTFGLENIDIITFVPATKKSERKRGFNQSKLFADNISKTLQIPVSGDILVKNPGVKTQHEIEKVRERYENVRGAYSCVGDIKGKNVLLVDDIKTSGASLDECARQMKFEGAVGVYCVTALITPPPEKRMDDKKQGLKVKRQ